MISSWVKYTLVFVDEYRLSDYAIGPEAKLNLVVRPTGERNGGAAVSTNCTNTSTTSSSGSTGSGVWQLLSTVLAKHFSPADAAKVQEQLIKVLSVLHLAYSCTLSRKCSCLLGKEWNTFRLCGCRKIITDMGRCDAAGLPAPTLNTIEVFFSSCTTAPNEHHVLLLSVYSSI